ncbi:xylulokinase [Microbacterium halotolerans]|uniref:xylulokinase n=1 Tax=Microbacterium halotolerans TaxID=246613 RepID=UPI0013C34C17|nr:xylulokinase [Microbacterium halotolerans]
MTHPTAPARELVAGVDSSTQSCKVELCDAATGEFVATGSAAHPPVTPPASEQDPRAWWDAFVAAFREARSDAAPGDRVIAISIAAQCHGLVALDDAGEPVRAAKLWNDTTSAEQMTRLLDTIGRERFVRATGTLPTAAFTISKLAWLAEHEPENFARTSTVLLPHDYLTFRLTGERVTDRSEASGTGYFDAAHGRYLPEFLAHIDPDRAWDAMLPRVAHPDEAVGTVHAQALEALGIAGPVSVGSGGGDQHAAALGLGLQPGDVAYSFGTSGVVSALSADPTFDLSGDVDGVSDMTGGYLPISSTLNAAKVTDAFARILGVGHAELDELAMSAPLDRSGPVLAAYLDGERTPNLPNAVGILGGIRTDSTREEVARAAYEGVVLGLIAAHRAIAREGVDTSADVIALGGGARSASYPQLLADLLGRPVHRTDAGEATARGAAVQAAAVATGRSVAEVRTAWAPAREIIASPREIDRDPAAAYAATAAIRTLDDA